TCGREMPAQSRTCRRSSSRFAWYPCIGRSASRLSRTRSGVVSARFLAPGIARFPLAARVPALALFHGKLRILRLRHRRLKDIQTADILRFPGLDTELLVQLFRIAACELSNRLNPQKFEVTNYRRSHRNQIPETSLRCRHTEFSLTWISEPSYRGN